MNKYKKVQKETQDIGTLVHKKENEARLNAWSAVAVEISSDVKGYDISKIYEFYRERFGESVNWNDGLMIAYKNKIYTLINPTDDEVEHERTHLLQQEKYGLTEWINLYGYNTKFRLDMEIEAYQAQAKYMRTHPLYSNRERMYRLDKMAELLSSDQYGNMISYAAAKLLLLK